MKKQITLLLAAALGTILLAGNVMAEEELTYNNGDFKIGFATREIVNDLNRDVIAGAQEVIEAAGGEMTVINAEADATKRDLPAARGVIVCNPPYGERMMEQRSAQRLYRALGKHLRYADGWQKFIISSEPEFEYYFGARADKKRKLYNGMIQCNLYQYAKTKGDERQ